MNRSKNIAQVVSPTKKWAIKLGNHSNIIVQCSRFPLDIILDFSISNIDNYQKLSIFFAKKFKSSADHSDSITIDDKFSFIVKQNSLKVVYGTHPFSGEVRLGEISNNELLQISQLFANALHR